MLKEQFRNYYIPKNKQEDNVIVKLLNFIIVGLYVVAVLVGLCTAYEILRAVVIALFADATTASLMKFFIIKLGYMLSYIGVVYLIVFLIKLCILGVFNSRATNSLTYERRGWLIVSSIACMLFGALLQFISSDILYKTKKLALSSDAINSNQTMLIIFILIICYIYVLGKVQEFRDILKDSGQW